MIFHVIDRDLPEQFIGPLAPVIKAEAACVYACTDYYFPPRSTACHKRAAVLSVRLAGAVSVMNADQVSGTLLIVLDQNHVMSKVKRNGDRLV